MKIKIGKTLKNTSEHFVSACFLYIVQIPTSYVIIDPKDVGSYEKNHFVRKWN